MAPKKAVKEVNSDEEKEEEEESNEEGSQSGSSDSDSSSDSDNSDGDNDSDSGSDSSSSSESESEDADDEKPLGKRKRVAKAPAKKAPAKKKQKVVSKKTAKKVTKKESASTKKKASSKTSSKDKVSVKEEAGNDRVMKKIKSTKKLDRLEEARKAYKWWEAPDLPKGINWQYLEHPGMAFPPVYIPHGVPLLYDGKTLTLTPEQEEMATFYASFPADGPQLGNPKVKPLFEANFFEDFKEILGNPLAKEVKQFSKLNFEEIRKYLELQKNLRKVATDEEKVLKKDNKETALLKYGYALIDGRVEKMGNFNMEPAGLFRGRGVHPKTGKLKKHVYPESVTLNLSEDAPIPICSMPGHSWEKVQHDSSVSWLAGWNENVQGMNKYVQLSASSSFKGKSDLDKYSKAIKLSHCIEKIRSDYTSKMKSKDRSDKQLGTAMWVIDILALRVGGEKGEDEADTVGCCSLRVEHMTFHSNNDSNKHNNNDSHSNNNHNNSTISNNNYEITLEFLGKDSMLYKQTINFALHGDLGKQVYQNLRLFVKDKKKDEEIFETLDPPKLNAHLSSLMKGLTAKVFRTYNASITLEKELPSMESLEGLSIQDKLLRYNAANREVAILCNHQRTVSKATEMGIENLQEKLTILMDQRKELMQWQEWFTNSNKDKKKSASVNNNSKEIPLKEDDTTAVSELKDLLTAAEEAKKNAKTDEEKLAAAKAVEEAKALEKVDKKRRLQEKHYFKTTPSSVEQITSRIEKWSEDIRKLEVDIRNRDENKEVALGTSKINYMDPRISVAWCKRCEVPIDKIFAKTLRDKFNWACAVPPHWKFE